MNASASPSHKQLLVRSLLWACAFVAATYWLAEWLSRPLQPSRVADFFALFQAPGAWVMVQVATLFGYDFKKHWLEFPILQTALASFFNVALYTALFYLRALTHRKS